LSWLVMAGLGFFIGKKFPVEWIPVFCGLMLFLGLLLGVLMLVGRVSAPRFVRWCGMGAGVACAMAATRQAIAMGWIQP
jgi:hypothetical protein